MNHQRAAMKLCMLLLSRVGAQVPSSSQRALRAFTTSSGPMPSSGSSAAAPAAAWGAQLAAAIRGNSTLASSSNNAPSKEEEEKKTKSASAETIAKYSSSSSNSKAIDSYWGFAPSKVTKPDGSAWRWNCFMPWESYTADVSIDVEKHHTPKNFTDKFAYYTVQTLKIPVSLFFQRRHMCHAMLLETVAAVPGMVGGMLLHLKSLRRFEQSGGWIKALLEEAENERMHLMTFIELAKPKWYERALVIAVQGVFVNAYFLAYVASPKLAHRITGYLEEEAVISYTEFLKDLDNGSFENSPAPQIAIDYWRLPPDSTLRDVVVVIRADEAHHRDLNHYASDIQSQGHELKEAPAPIGYH